MSREVAGDVAIVGAGPAGLAAALAVAKAGKHVVMLDESPAVGGQIWRASLKGLHPDAAEALGKVAPGMLEWIPSATVFDRVDGRLLAETPGGVVVVRAPKVILATGASELFLPFPGWTLPNVVGVGAMQALIKSGLDVRGKRVVVAGTGPLLFAVAFQLEVKHAVVPIIAEQSPLGAVLGFGFGLLRYRDKLRQAMTMGGAASRAKFGRWVRRADGDGRLERVELSDGRSVECDYLACAYGLSPNTELAQIVGCALEGGFVEVDENQETSAPGVYCAGEPTSIGGVDLSIAEGAIAGCSAAGVSVPDWCRKEKAKQAGFARMLDRAFALRDELRSLADEDTIVCRCEDVRLRQLKGISGSREAKLQTRCGMGPCQGKVCGSALRFMRGWEPGTVRPPMKPVSIQSLADGYDLKEKR